MSNPLEYELILILKPPSVNGEAPTPVPGENDPWVGIRASADSLRSIADGQSNVAFGLRTLLNMAGEWG